MLLARGMAVHCQGRLRPRAPGRPPTRGGRRSKALLNAPRRVLSLLLRSPRRAAPVADPSQLLSRRNLWSRPSTHYATFKFLVGRCQCQRSSPRTVGSHFPFQCGPMQLGWVIMDRPDRPLAHIGAQTRVWGWGRTEERSSRPRSRGGRMGLYMGNQF